jgi:eukaryotic-like serine/threonine-protein kinase
MHHPNIIRFENVYKSPTNLYIVTEFCEKGDLLTHMTRKGNLSEKEALSIFADVAEGVKHLFRMGIIHRDLKPGNILNDGQTWKVADFGFAI